MDKYERTFELLEASGLNWTVNRLPLCGPDGEPTDSFGIFRNDNKKWLGTVGNKYEVMQNAELAEAIVEACEGSGMEATKGGSFSGGRKVYIHAELPETVIGNSGVKRYVTGLSSHDGSTAIAFGSTSTVVTCQNTFFRLYRSGSMERFRHGSGARERLRQAMADMKKAIAFEGGVMENLERMQEVKTGEKMVKDIIARIYEQGMGITLADELTKVREKKLTLLNDAMQQEVVSHGPTLWAIFNGVTRYTNHMVKTKDSAKYVMDGAGYKLNGVAYDAIMEWIEKNTAKSYAVS